MHISRSLALGTLSLLIAGGLVACGQSDQNSNTTTTNTATTLTQPSPGLVLGVAPAKGPAAGGTTVKITGEGFTGSPTVLFGSTEAKDIKVVNDKEISAIAPAGEKGQAVDVILQSPNAPTSTLVSGYTYE